MMARTKLISIDPEERFYTPERLGKKWSVSPQTIREWFKEEDGVLKWGRTESKPGKKRAHISLRIPPEVAERVRRRMSGD